MVIARSHLSSSLLTSKSLGTHHKCISDMQWNELSYRRYKNQKSVIRRRRIVTEVHRQIDAKIAKICHTRLKTSCPVSEAGEV
ncbi:hypothetical protein ACTXT7_008086 [Hymenolepis weldensis]